MIGAASETCAVLAGFALQAPVPLGVERDDAEQRQIKLDLPRVEPSVVVEKARDQVLQAGRFKAWRSSGGWCRYQRARRTMRGK
eukprot:2030157-Rhodomonas_salina.3